MLKTLENLDSKKIAGVLARTALLLENESNIIYSNRTPDEIALQNKIIEEIKEINNISGELSKKDIEKIISYIDQELEALDHRIDNVSIENISNPILIPSDVLEIKVIPNVRNIYLDKFQDELKYINRTIKKPDREHHIENIDDEKSPSDISIFIKKFPDKYPYKSFNLLVVGHRDKLTFNVHQVWRLYDDIVDFINDKNLIDVVKNFAEKFGLDIEYKENISKFYYSEEAKNKQEFKFNLDNSMKNKKGKNDVMFSHFSQKIDNNESRMSMILAIDLVKYVSYLRKHGYKINH